MFERFLRGLKSMELEQQIYHLAVCVCAISVFLPWFGGKLYTDTDLWNGFSYYTAYVGRGIFFMQIYLLALTISPMVGGPTLVRKSARQTVRLLLSMLSLCLLLAVFSILLRINAEIPKYSVRFGIFICIIASIVATLYAFLRWQQLHRFAYHETFRHPDEELRHRKELEREESHVPTVPPPPPPPPPPPAEDHHPHAHVHHHS